MKLLTGSEEKFLESETELAKNLDLLLSGLRKLTQRINQHADQIENIYLRVAKGKGNA